MKYKVLIAEDERLSREELAYQLQQEEDFTICPSAENGRQFLHLYRKYEPDIVFIDIQMPHITGIDAIEMIFQENEKLHKKSPYVVFITAYEEYAQRAFGVEAVDYLLKPYGPIKLKETIERLKRRISKPDIIAPSAYLLIEDNERVVVLQPEQILYACRNERLIEIHTIDDQIKTKMTLTELEKKLCGLSFFRPHRSYLVNLNAIREIVPWFNGAFNLILKHSDVKIPVSRTVSKTLFERLQK